MFWIVYDPCKIVDDAYPYQSVLLLLVIVSCFFSNLFDKAFCLLSIKYVSRRSFGSFKVKPYRSAPPDNPFFSFPIVEIYYSPDKSDLFAVLKSEDIYLSVMKHRIFADRNSISIHNAQRPSVPEDWAF